VAAACITLQTAQPAHAAAQRTKSHAAAAAARAVGPRPRAAAAPTRCTATRRASDDAHPASAAAGHRVANRRLSPAPDATTAGHRAANRRLSPAPDATTPAAPPAVTGPPARPIRSPSGALTARAPHHEPPHAQPCPRCPQPPALPALPPPPSSLGHATPASCPSGPAGFGHSGGHLIRKRQMGDSPFRAVGQMGGQKGGYRSKMLRCV
jgi:hypothetical protein